MMWCLKKYNNIDNKNQEQKYGLTQTFHPLAAMFFAGEGGVIKNIL